MPISTGGTNNVPKLLCDVIGDRGNEYVVELNVGGQILVHGERLAIDALREEGSTSSLAHFSSSSGLEVKGAFALDVEESGDFVIRESASGVVYMRVSPSSGSVSIPSLVRGGGGGGGGGPSFTLAG
eukprot:6092751-Pleurochrysis_carterae.AAC.1